MDSLAPFNTQINMQHAGYNSHQYPETYYGHMTSPDLHYARDRYHGMAYTGGIESYLDPKYASNPAFAARLPYLPFQTMPPCGSYDYNFEPAFIRKRNERERQRVKCVNEGYARLREHLPEEFSEKRLSKVETLRGAIQYITKLQQMLGVETSSQTNKNKNDENHDKGRKCDYSNVAGNEKDEVKSCKCAGKHGAQTMKTEYDCKDMGPLKIFKHTATNINHAKISTHNRSKNKSQNHQEQTKFSRDGDYNSVTPNTMTFYNDPFSSTHLSGEHDRFSDSKSSQCEQTATRKPDYLSKHYRYNPYSKSGRFGESLSPRKSCAQWNIYSNSINYPQSTHYYEPGNYRFHGSKSPFFYHDHSDDVTSSDSPSSSVSS